jgi:hypothetical protein
LFHRGELWDGRFTSLHIRATVHAGRVADMFCGHWNPAMNQNAAARIID